MYAKMIVIFIHLNCADGNIDIADCGKVFDMIQPNANKSSYFDGSESVRKPKTNIDVGAFPKEADDDLEPSLVPFKFPVRDRDLINNP